MPQLTIHSPVGEITISEEDGALVAVDWGRGRDQLETPLLRAAADQLMRYFDGELERFDLPLRPAGPEAHRRIWRAMCEIPYGATETYGQLARRAGTIARAVGQGCGANPLPILIPCHRVLAASGLGGYSGRGGVDTKIALLRLEGALL
jgi:methylated-DNA-[protein]-cysteine S-methyltransferase